ncbi:preprotein translocase subunit SecE [Klugiella xanthotipulae]|uniref:Protein translocase subunit SecE n=1 Tax=Klugiella xanthotipulae TaxID=244735 RepID=A0A543HHB5_9MICO|nr:preprotein translocase subunit SecE [Klugiella xanthotipulae]TQM57726.1 preprotein translocase subunit SecE [Klugiella xanthotipulae]
MTDNVVDEPGEELVASAKQERAEKKTWFGRIILFIQQVFAELKKVVTPTRKELFSFTGVVLVFVLIMMGIVWVLDQAFGFLVVFVFGDASMM